MLQALIPALRVMLQIEDVGTYVPIDWICACEIDSQGSKIEHTSAFWNNHIN